MFNRISSIILIVSGFFFIGKTEAAPYYITIENHNPNVICSAAQINHENTVTPDPDPQPAHGGEELLKATWNDHFVFPDTLESAITYKISCHEANIIEDNFINIIWLHDHHINGEWTTKYYVGNTSNNTAQPIGSNGNGGKTYDGTGWWSMLNSASNKFRFTFQGISDGSPYTSYHYHFHNMNILVE